MSDIPNNWYSTKIVDVLSINDNGKPFQQGWSPQCESYPSEEGEWGVLKTTAIQQGEFWQHENKALPKVLEPRPHLEVKPGDILMTCAGPRNRCGVVCFVKETRSKLLMSGKMYRFRPDPEILIPKYLEAFIISHNAQRAIDRMKTGINDSGLNLTHGRFAELEVPLAPVNEQHRIVEKIEELFSELDKGVEALKTARSQLKIYRQAVLKHAFEGKLTAQWREEHKDKLESPEQLLARIQQEREARYQQQLTDWQAALKTWEQNGKEGKKSGKPKEPEKTFPLDISNLSELPIGWNWVPLFWLLSIENKPMITGPFGTMLKKNEHQESGVPVLGIENIGQGKFVYGNKIFVTEAKATELESFRVRSGDVVISRSGTVGEICEIPDGFDDALISTNLLRVSLNRDVILSQFFVLMFQGGGVKSQVKDLCKGSSREFLNQSILGSIHFPLCSLSEQKNIIEQIEAKFSFLDKLSEEIDENLIRLETLRQSILKKAFSGQLVPQDPNDEPAAVLCDRIRAAKAAQPKPSKKPRQSKTTSSPRWSGETPP